MGTRGYKVYRHRGRYFVRYNHYDSYPEGLGLEWAHNVPRNPEDCQKWLESMRQQLEEDLHLEHSTSSDDKYYVSEDPPENDLFIEWMYEIDLDHEVFHVDSSPMFCLKNMPNDEVFLASTGFDSYDNRAYKHDTPEEHRYSRVPPPQVSQTLLDRYERGPRTMLAKPRYGFFEDTKASIDDLLFVSQSASVLESLRITLLQVMVGCVMRYDEHGRLLRSLDVPNRQEIPKYLANLGRFLVKFATNPPIYGCSRVLDPAKKKHGFTWMSPRVCLRLTTHLDNADVLKATVIEIAEEITKHPGVTGVVYGVGFSFFHCVLIRVDTDDHMKSKHTPALQFLPSFYADSPCTPGITAMARLGCKLSDPLNALHVEAPKEGLRCQLPYEVWMQIADNLSVADDLVTMARISSASWEAANKLLRYPHLGASRLTRVREEAVETLDDDGRGRGGDQLWAAEFDAKDDKHGDVFLQLAPRLSSTDFLSLGCIYPGLGTDEEMWVPKYGILYKAKA